VSRSVRRAHRARPSRRPPTTSTRCVRPPLRVCSTYVHRAGTRWLHARSEQPQAPAATRAPSEMCGDPPAETSTADRARGSPIATCQHRSVHRHVRRPVHHSCRTGCPSSGASGRAWAIVRARRRRNGEQRRMRRAADRHSEAPPHLPRSRREPRHGALEHRYRQRVTHTHTQNLSVSACTSWSRTAHTRSSPTQSPPATRSVRQASTKRPYIVDIEHRGNFFLSPPQTHKTPTRHPAQT